MRVFQALMAVCLFSVAVNARTVSVDKEGPNVEVIQDSPAKEEVVQDSPDKEDCCISEDSEELEAPVSENSEEAADEEQVDEILNDEEQAGEGQADAKQADAEQDDAEQADEEQDDADLDDAEQDDAEQDDAEQDDAEVADDAARDVPAEVEVLKEFPASLEDAEADPAQRQGYVFVPKQIGCSKSRDGGDWRKSFDHAGWSKCKKGNQYISGFWRSAQGALWEDRIGRLEEAKCCKVNDLFRGQNCMNVDWSRSFDQKNTWNSCPEKYFLHGLKRSNGNELGNIEQAHCCRPQNNAYYGKCYEQDISESFDKKGWSSCQDGYLAVGLYRSTCDKLHCIEKIKCCQMALHLRYA